MSNPNYRGLSPASVRASNAGRGASKKKDTKPELMLRKALFQVGLYPGKVNHSLPGKPDLVFMKLRVAIFCDGDFWHGRNWLERKSKLEKGHNAQYWIKKIENNRKRDRRNSRLLRKDGWMVLRVWESKISANARSVAERIARRVN